MFTRKKVYMEQLNGFYFVNIKFVVTLLYIQIEIPTMQLDTWSEG